MLKSWDVVASVSSSRGGWVGGRVGGSRENQRSFTFEGAGSPLPDGQRENAIVFFVELLGIDCLRPQPRRDSLAVLVAVLLLFLIL